MNKHVTLWSIKNDKSRTHSWTQSSYCPIVCWTWCQRPRTTASSAIVVEEVRQLLGAGLRRMLKRGQWRGLRAEEGEGTGKERRRISVTVSQPQVQRVGIRESKLAKNTSGALYVVGPQRRTLP